MITITVTGTPAPQGSKRHVGGGRMVEMSKAVGPWREAVRAETARAMKDQGQEMLIGPAGVWITFMIKRPAWHYGTGRNRDRLRADAPSYPGTRPDLDKLIRAVLDGLTEGGVWHDDGQVVYLAAAKKYGQAGCCVSVDTYERGHPHDTADD